MQPRPVSGPRSDCWQYYRHHEVPTHASHPSICGLANPANEEDEDGLMQRGSRTLWITPELLEQRNALHQTTPGTPAPPRPHHRHLSEVAHDIQNVAASGLRPGGISDQPDRTDARCARPYDGQQSSGNVATAAKGAAPTRTPRSDRQRRAASLYRRTMVAGEA